MPALSTHDTRVDQFEFGIDASGGEVEYPIGDLFAVSVGLSPSKGDARSHLLLISIMHSHK
jgi:hypothetical protein